MLKKINVDIKPTMSKRFFLPLFNEQFRLQRLELLKNCYLYNNLEDKEFCILYKFSGDRDFIKYEDYIFNHRLFIGHEDYEEYVLYRFRLTSTLKEQLTELRLGKLPDMKKEDKDAIIVFNKRVMENNNFILGGINGDFKTYMAVEPETFCNHIKYNKVIDANELYELRKVEKLDEKEID